MFLEVLVRDCCHCVYLVRRVKYPEMGPLILQVKATDSSMVCIRSAQFQFLDLTRSLLKKMILYLTYSDPVIGPRW